MQAFRISSPYSCSGDLLKKSIKIKPRFDVQNFSVNKKTPGVNAFSSFVVFTRAFLIHISAVEQDALSIKDSRIDTPPSRLSPITEHMGRATQTCQSRLLKVYNCRTVFLKHKLDPIQVYD